MTDRKDLAGATNGMTDFEVIKEFNQAREAAGSALENFVVQLKDRGNSGPEGFSIGSLNNNVSIFVFLLSSKKIFNFVLIEILFFHSLKVFSANPICV